MQDGLKIVRNRRKSSITFWSNHFLLGQGHIIFVLDLTFLNLWSFVLLLAFSGNYICIHPMYWVAPFCAFQ